MAVKKTQLYASLWAGCDKLRGGMDSSEYKNYILTMLFLKYVSDKYKNKGEYADLDVFDKAHDNEPDIEKRIGCSFDDIVALKGNNNIGEGIDKIIARLAEKNSSLRGVIDIAHFNDETKMGKAQEMVDKLTGLVSIFQRPELDFSDNKAEGDDIIGDAYEYLMRKFATESGKSKGQFYTPAEVSRILANVVGVQDCRDPKSTVYDPACGSGSLLLRAIASAPLSINGYGQEKEVTTAGLAKLNAVLHNKPEITIDSGNTFANPKFLDGNSLRRFDYIVANPPFSLKSWTDGIADSGRSDIYGRFNGFGDVPPEKNGDYAWIMHILKSLKSNGKAAVILPHGVLFRGNAEGTIRKTIIQSRVIKGIIGLPANLFYGTGIPACIIVLDKDGVDKRQGIFMIDASHGYVKDGNKNRLREQDVYKIITIFNKQNEMDPKYARFVSYKEIEENDFNLNIPRYIDYSESDDVQDIYAHIHGVIPVRDIDCLSNYWTAFPSLKSDLLSRLDDKYYQMNVDSTSIAQCINSNVEFVGYQHKLCDAFKAWKDKTCVLLTSINENGSAKELIENLANDIVEEFEHLVLIDKYDVYQVLLAYWNEVMSDDVSLIIADPSGYNAAKDVDDFWEEIAQGKKKGDRKHLGWEGRLIPKSIMIDVFFEVEKNSIQDLENSIANSEAELAELIESASEDSALAEVSENGKAKEKDLVAKIIEITQNVETEETKELVKLREQFPMSKKKIDAYVATHPLCERISKENKVLSKSVIEQRLLTIRTIESVPNDLKNDVNMLTKARELLLKNGDDNKELKKLAKALDDKCRERYGSLTNDEIIDLLVNKKWYKSIELGIDNVYVSLCHYLSSRLKELCDRYDQTLESIEHDILKIEKELSVMLGELTGEDNDIRGLEGLKLLLGDDTNE